MDFDLREWIKEGFLEAVGHRPDYWIILNSTGYFEKGILLQEDLAEIKAKIDEKNAPLTPVEDEEETVEETYNEEVE